MISPNTQTNPQPTLLDAIWDSIITPGASKGLIAATNAALIGVMIFVAIFSLMGYFDYHMVILFVLSVCLIITFNWYVLCDYVCMWYCTDWKVCLLVISKQ